MNAINPLRTLYIGASPFMLESHVRGMRFANTQRALNNGHHRFEFSCVAARNNDNSSGRGAVDIAQDAGGFERQFVGTPDQICDEMTSGRYDVVCIATPDRDHAFYATAALEADVAVISEKSIANTLKNAQLMVDADAESDAWAYVNYNYTGLDAVVRFRKLVADGRIVNLDNPTYNAIIRFLQDWGINDRSNWRFNWELAGLAGVIADIGTHVIDAILWCLEPTGDEVVSVSGTTRYYEGFGADLKLLRASEVDHEARAVDAASFVLHMKSGSTISGSCDRHSRLSKADMAMELFGQKGSAKWELFHHNKLGFAEHAGVEDGEQGMKEIFISHFVPGLTAGFETGHGNNALNVLRWLDNDRQGKCPGRSFQEAMESLRLAEAIRLAGIKGTAIELASVQP